MLTDYHLHLRPDGTEQLAADAFTEANVARYLDAAKSAGIEELGVSEHVYRFRQALEVWNHPYWVEQATDDLDEYCEFVRTTPLRLGVEMDWIPGAGERIENLLSTRDFDYVVGSVHFIGEGENAVDDPDWDAWGTSGDPEDVWTRYFTYLADAARSGLYDILAHPDLVKVWGKGKPVPDGDLARFYEPAIEAIAETGIAVEVSTAGLRKPVGEIYPAPRFAELCVDAGAAFALSSDAHLPEQVGFEYRAAVELMRGWGIEEICFFEKRERRLVPLDLG
jgi:histidinol-phosphatase (PHP family)